MCALLHDVIPSPPVKVGDRIAQMILEVIVTPKVEEVDDIEETKRGAGGFGSTGVEGAIAAALEGEKENEKEFNTQKRS